MSSDSMPSPSASSDVPIEAEVSVVGALLLRSDRLADALDEVSVEDFGDVRLRHILQAIVEVTEAGNPVDFVTVGQALSAKGLLAAVGGNKALIAAAERVTSAASLMHHAKIVARWALKRRMIGALTESLDKARELRPGVSDHEVADFIQETEETVYTASRSSAIREPLEGLDEIATALESAIRASETRAGVDLGIWSLDEILLGVEPGEMVTLGARPGKGKTAFGLQVALNRAREGDHVFILNLEMSRDQIAARCLCNLSDVHSERVRRRTLSDDEFANLAYAAEEIARMKVSICRGSGTTLAKLRSHLRRAALTKPVSFVIVDYLQLMRHPKAENRVAEVGELSRGLKDLAEDFRVPVLAIAQLNRAVEARNPPRPQLSDLKESGSIEQDSDRVMFLWEENDEPGAPLMCTVAKNRHGRTGEVKLDWRKGTGRISTLNTTEEYAL